MIYILHFDTKSSWWLVVGHLLYDRDTQLGIEDSLTTHVEAEFHHWDPLLTRDAHCCHGGDSGSGKGVGAN